MNKEIPEHIYFRKDIDKAFNMGVEIIVSVFEQTIGMPPDSQKYVLQKIKDMLLKDKIEQNTLMS